MTKSVYLILGEDEYLVSAKTREIIDTLLPPEDRALGLEIIESSPDATMDAAITALNRCEEAIQTLGLFCSRKVVWLKDAGFFHDNITGKSETVKQRVNDFTALINKGLSSGQVLVITAPKVDKRYAFFKACSAAGEVHEFAVSDKGYQAEKDAGARLRDIIQKNDLKMPGDVIAYFQEKVGANTRQMVNEIEKLVLFMGDRKTVTKSDIDTIVSSSRESLAWDLADAFGRRDLAGSLKILRQLFFQKENPIGLIMGLSGRIRDLMFYKEALNNGWLVVDRSSYGKTEAKWKDLPPEIDKGFSEEFDKDPRKVHPYRASLLAAQAKGFSMPELARCRKALMNAHVKLVSSRVPQEMVLELLLIRMLGAGGKKTEASHVKDDIQGA